MSGALPVESRPLLAVGISHYDEDGGEDFNCRAQQQQCFSSSSSLSGEFAVDWLAIARHTLKDVTRTLPDARSSELRVKQCDGTITKIEAAREQEQEPSLRPEIYKLPQDRPSAGSEIAKVRASMEVVAARIRDAIAKDVKQRLLMHRPASESLSVAPVATSSTAVKQRSAPSSSSSSTQTAADEHLSEPAVAFRSMREQHAQERDALSRSELLNRHSAERTCSETLLAAVCRFMSATAASFESLQQATARREEEARCHAQQQQQQRPMQVQTLLRECEASEHSQRSMLESLEGSQRSALSSNFLLSAHFAAAATRKRRSVPNVRDGGCDARQFQLQDDDQTTMSQKQMLSVQQQEQQDAFAVHVDLSHSLRVQLLDECEVDTRGLIAQWEHDAHDKLLRSVTQWWQSHTVILSTRLSSTFFETWRCFALKRREQHRIEDQLRHQRILEYTLSLQQSQLDGSLDSIVIDNHNHVSSFAHPSSSSAAKQLFLPIRERRAVSPASSSVRRYRDHYFQYQNNTATTGSVRSVSPGGGVSPVPLPAAM